MQHRGVLLRGMRCRSPGHDLAQQRLRQHSSTELVKFHPPQHNQTAGTKGAQGERRVALTVFPESGGPESTSTSEGLEDSILSSAAISCSRG